MKNPSSEFDFKQIEDSPGFLLWQVSTLWHRGVNKTLDEIEITHPQFILLASLLWLNNKEEVVTQIHLSQHSQTDPMTTSAIIKILERKEFVKRSEHPKDTRAKIIKFTPKGLRLTKKAVGLFEKFDTDFFAPLDTKGRQFNRMLASLKPGTTTE